MTEREAILQLLREVHFSRDPLLPCAPNRISQAARKLSEVHQIYYEREVAAATLMRPVAGRSVVLPQGALEEILDFLNNSWSRELRIWLREVNLTLILPVTLKAKAHA